MGIIQTNIYFGFILMIEIDCFLVYFYSHSFKLTSRILYDKFPSC